MAATPPELFRAAPKVELNPIAELMASIERYTIGSLSWRIDRHMQSCKVYAAVCNYVHRSFFTENAPSPEWVTKIHQKLRDVIQKAIETGTLASIDWNRYPLPHQLVHEELCRLVGPDDGSDREKEGEGHLDSSEACPSMSSESEQINSQPYASHAQTITRTDRYPPNVQVFNARFSVMQPSLAETISKQDISSKQALSAPRLGLRTIPAVHGRKSSLETSPIRSREVNGQQEPHVHSHSQTQVDTKTSNGLPPTIPAVADGSNTKAVSANRLERSHSAESGLREASEPTTQKFFEPCEGCLGFETTVQDVLGQGLCATCRQSLERERAEDQEAAHDRADGIGQGDALGDLHVHDDERVRPAARTADEGHRQLLMVGDNAMNGVALDVKPLRGVSGDESNNVGGSSDTEQSDDEVSDDSSSKTEKESSQKPERCDGEQLIRNIIALATDRPIQLPTPRRSPKDVSTTDSDASDEASSDDASSDEEASEEESSDDGSSIDKSADDAASGTESTDEDSSDAESSDDRAAPGVCFRDEGGKAGLRSAVPCNKISDDESSDSSSEGEQVGEVARRAGRRRTALWTRAETMSSQCRVGDEQTSNMLICHCFADGQRSA